jgi:two-component system sensor histidine kinase KdpD
LLTVVLVSVVGGLLPALLATTIAFLLCDFLFAVPLYSLRTDHLIDLVALIAFAAVAVVIGILVDVLTRQSVQAARGHAEAEALARLVADSVLAAPELLTEMAPRLRATFDLDAVAVLGAAGTRSVGEQPSGQATDTAPASFFVALDDKRALVLTGGQRPGDDSLLRAFIGQLRLDGRRRQLRNLDAQP